MALRTLGMLSSIMGVRPQTVILQSATGIFVLKLSYAPKPLSGLQYASLTALHVSKDFGPFQDEPGPFLSQ